MSFIKKRGIPSGPEENFEPIEFQFKFKLLSTDLIWMDFYWGYIQTPSCCKRKFNYHRHEQENVGQGRLRLNATLDPIQNGQLKAIKLKFRIETKKLLTLTNNFITPPPNLTYLSYYFPIWLISLIIFRKLNCYGWIVSHTMLPSFQSVI